MTEALWRRLGARRDGAALAVFRMALGTLVLVSAVRFLVYGWIDPLFVRPTFQFKYWGFGWVPSLGAPHIYLLFVALAVLGLMVALGLFYRPAAGALFVAFSWLQLMDVSTYLNHYYLVSLLCGLMFVVPAHRTWSLDARRRPQPGDGTAPGWSYLLLQGQVAVVYVFAGLAKLGPDWLLHAQPLNLWLSARTSLPWVGELLDQRWVAYAAAWAGFLFDTTVVAFLVWRRSRPFAYVAVLGFHALTWVLFPIGMFPFIMITAALVFFSPDWPRRRARGALKASPQPQGVANDAVGSPPWRWVALTVAVLYAGLQVGLPLRAHLYEGNVLWHEQGMRFSWRVMAREKTGTVRFVVTDPPTGRRWEVSPREHLTELQEREMSVQPDLILQLARHIARLHAARLGHPVEVHAHAQASINGRLSQPLVDSAVDLARERDGLSAKAWILPAPEQPPIHLKPFVLRRP